MRVLVTGAKGLIGSDVVSELVKRGNEVFNTYFDITDPNAVSETVINFKPNVIVHCAGWTNVESAELSENRSKVYDSNVNGTLNLVKACKEVGCKLVYISTDYVFDGSGMKPWDSDCKIFNPLNYYGKTKLEGEKIVSTSVEKFFVIRTSWVFGKNGKNFVKTMLKLGIEKEKVEVVSDQIGSPTYSLDLARFIVDICESEKYGFYNATNEGTYVSWYDFCREIYKIAKISTVVVPVTTEEYNLSKVKRPKNSRLDKSKLLKNGFAPLPTWNDALSRFLNEISL